MVKVAFIINGSRKLKKENQELINHCVNHNALLVEQKVTEHPGHATELAKEYTKSKPTCETIMKNKISALSMPKLG